jgi:hypothetical protein
MKSNGFAIGILGPASSISLRSRAATFSLAGSVLGRIARVVSLEPSRPNSSATIRSSVVTAGLNFGLSPKARKKLFWRHDLDTEGFFQDEQIFVLGNDRFGSACESTRQKQIVIRVSAALLSDG